MQTDLRPMSLGEILDRTAQLYRTNFLLFAGIAAVDSGILLLLNLGQLGITGFLQKMHMSKQLPWVTASYVVVIVPLIVICAAAAVAANNRAVAWVNLGQPTTIVGAYRSILPRLGRYIWLACIVGFIVYIPFVLIAAAYFIFVFAYVRPHHISFEGGANADTAAIAVFAMVSLGFALLVAAWLLYAILMGLRYSLAIAASVVEDLKARPAIRRSIQLTKGSRVRIFMLALLIIAVQIGLALVTQAVFFFAMFTAVKNKQDLPLWIQVAQQIVGFLTNSFIGPMYATGLTLFYYDQRIRKEGYDIEWMMEAAGMSPSRLLAAAAEPRADFADTARPSAPSFGPAIAQPLPTPPSPGAVDPPPQPTASPEDHNG
jgi:hypothetical protein